MGGRWVSVEFALGSMGWRSGVGKENLVFIIFFGFLGFKEKRVPYTAGFTDITLNRELAQVVEEDHNVSLWVAGCTHCNHENTIVRAATWIAFQPTTASHS